MPRRRVRAKEDMDGNRVVRQNITGDGSEPGDVMNLRQTIRFCSSSDGTNIAVASCGEGPVILRAAHWLSHVDYDLESPIWRPWVEALSARNRFVRYDPRGCGLSERYVADVTIAAWCRDLEAVAATIDEPRFVLLGLSQGAHTLHTGLMVMVSLVPNLHLSAMLLNACGVGRVAFRMTGGSRPGSR